MIRYLRLYAYFVRFSFSKSMEFRLDFFFRIVMDCIYYAVNIGFYTVLFRHTSLIGNWNLDQIYVFVGGVFVVDALMMTVISNNMWMFSTYINKGDLDYYLVRPVSSLFFLSVREFAANSFLNLIIAISFWVWTIVHYTGSWGFLQLFVYVLLLINGTFLYYCTQMFGVLPIFWTQSSQGFVEIFMNFHSFMERPHHIFDGWMRKVLVTILPYSLMTSFPAEVFFTGLNFELLLHVFLVTVGLFLFVLFIWNRGLKIYSSASS